MPQIPASLGRLQRIPLFMPGFHALVDADAEGATLTITDLIARDTLSLVSLAITRAANFRHNGRTIAATWQHETDGRVRCRLELVLQVGDQLGLSWTDA